MTDDRRSWVSRAVTRVRTYVVGALRRMHFALCPPWIVALLAWRQRRHEIEAPSTPHRGERTNDAREVDFTVIPNGGYCVVAAQPAFAESSYDAAFAVLQLWPYPKLLDLTAVAMIPVSFFEQLRTAWAVEPGSVRRLGIVFSFEAWVFHHRIARRELSALAAMGVEVGLFYAQQRASVAPWFARGGTVFHHLAEVLSWFHTRWKPAGWWGPVVDAVVLLVRKHVRAEGVAKLVTEMALRILAAADVLGDEEAGEKAVMLAFEALDLLPKEPSADRCRAQRVLGLALMVKGESSQGLAVLGEALTTAMAVNIPTEGALALLEIGLQALRRGNNVRAEKTFQRGIEWLSLHGASDLLATLHHNVAIAVHRQGRSAEHYAARALELRPDKQSARADEDRALLAKLRSGATGPVTNHHNAKGNA